MDSDLKPNKKCPICKKPFVQFNSMRQKVCGDHQCAIEYGRLENEKKRKKEIRKNLVEYREKNKTKPERTKEAQQAINEYVRFRDYHEPCISCGNFTEQRFGGGYDAGHFVSVGSNPSLRFCLKNIFRQCKKCNRDLSGNHTEYRKRLVEKFGEDYVTALEYNQEIKKYTKEDLIRIKKIFKKKTRLRKKQLGLS